MKGMFKSGNVSWHETALGERINLNRLCAVRCFSHDGSLFGISAAGVSPQSLSEWRMQNIARDSENSSEEEFFDAHGTGVIHRCTSSGFIYFYEGWKRVICGSLELLVVAITATTDTWNFLCMWRLDSRYLWTCLQYVVCIGNLIFFCYTVPLKDCLHCTGYVWIDLSAVPPDSEEKIRIPVVQGSVSIHRNSLT